MKRKTSTIIICSLAFSLTSACALKAQVSAPPSETSVSPEESTLIYADKTEYLTAMKKGLCNRWDDSIGLKRSSYSDAQYINKMDSLNQLELDCVEEFDDQTFEDSAFDAAVHEYIDTLLLIKKNKEHYLSGNSTLEDYNTRLELASKNRLEICVKMYDDFGLELPDEMISSFRAGSPYAKEIESYESTDFDTQDATVPATQSIDDNSPETSSPVSSTISPSPSETLAPQEETTSSVSMGASNALSSAKSYLSFTNFSYQGLIDQLIYEQYTLEDSQYAADNCGADWNQQALGCAQNYLGFSNFSKSGLKQQLVFEKFTDEQAAYAVENCGADWFAQAVGAAADYLSFSSFSHAGLVEQLVYEGFTPEEAEYGVSQNGY